MTGPDKKKLYPNENIKTVCYISNLPKRPNVEIGEYTYYSDNKKSPEKFYENIEHHYEFLGDKLIIGKFCAIAEGVKFIMTEILRQYFINHPQSIDKYTFLQNSAFTHWVKEKCSKMC